MILRKLLSLYQLNGFNNLDLIINKKGKVFLIEINARPGLSINIISRLNKLYSGVEGLGTLIIYSNRKIKISKSIYNFFNNKSKSSSYSELPIKNQIIEKNEPICLLHFTFSKNENLEDKIKKITYKFRKELLNNESKYKQKVR